MGAPANISADSIQDTVNAEVNWKKWDAQTQLVMYLFDINQEARLYSNSCCTPITVMCQVFPT